MIDLKNMETLDELKELATELKISAAADHRTAEGTYFADQKEADEFTADPRIGEWIANEPCIQAIVFENRIFINLVLTVEDFKGQEQRWHLSMSRISGPKPGRVPDDDTEIMASAFFDEYEEIPTKSVVYPDIRDFLAEKLKSIRTTGHPSSRIA